MGTEATELRSVLASSAHDMGPGSRTDEDEMRTLHGYTLSAAALVAAASGDLLRSVLDVQHVRTEYEKPKRAPRKHSGPVTDSTRETKREKRRRLKDTAR